VPFFAVCSYSASVAPFSRDKPYFCATTVHTLFLPMLVSQPNQNAEQQPQRKRKRYSDAAVARALETVYGDIAKAAEMLGCDETLIRRRMAFVPRCMEAYKRGREKLLEQAANVVARAALSGDAQAAEFVLLHGEQFCDPPKVLL
jgi:hypothetical protein